MCKISDPYSAPELMETFWSALDCSSPNGAFIQAGTSASSHPKMESLLCGALGMSLDGQRFLMVKQGERKPQPMTEMILVQNWFEELKRICPMGK